MGTVLPRHSESSIMTTLNHIQRIISNIIFLRYVDRRTEKQLISSI